MLRTELKRKPKLNNNKSKKLKLYKVIPIIIYEKFINRII